MNEFYLNKKFEYLKEYAPDLEIPDVIFLLIAQFATHSKYNEEMYNIEYDYFDLLKIPAEFVKFDWYEYMNNIRVPCHHVMSNENCNIIPPEIYIIEKTGGGIFEYVQGLSSFMTIKFIIPCTECIKKDVSSAEQGEYRLIKKSKIIFDGVIRFSFKENHNIYGQIQTLEVVIS